MVSCDIPNTFLAINFKARLHVLTLDLLPLMYELEWSQIERRMSHYKIIEHNV